MSLETLAAVEPGARVVIHRQQRYTGETTEIQGEVERVAGGVAVVAGDDGERYRLSWHSRRPPALEHVRQDGDWRQLLPGDIRVKVHGDGRERQEARA